MKYSPVDSSHIYHARCGRNMKLWFVRSFMAACVCFIYWSLLGLLSSEDWSIFQRSVLTHALPGARRSAFVSCKRLIESIRLSNMVRRHRLKYVYIKKFRILFIPSISTIQLTLIKMILLDVSNCIFTRNSFYSNLITDISNSFLTSWKS